MIKIGLTGGIATGKSTVSNYLLTKNIPVIDCDILARQAVSVGKPAYVQVVEAFSEEILLVDKSINREKLGEIVFNNKDKRLLLENIIHKQVLEDVNEQLTAYNNTNKELVVIDIPLLFEAKLEYLVDEIWVVFCSEEQQIERLMARNSLSYDQAQARINSQMSIASKMKLADVVIDNSGSTINLYKQVDNRISKLIPQLSHFVNERV